MKDIIIFLFLFLFLFSCHKINVVHKSAETNIIKSDTSKIRFSNISAEEHKSDPKEFYQKAYINISKMLSNQEPLDFKKAVFITENTYYENALDYSLFCNRINKIVLTCNNILKSKKMLYNYSDSIQVRKNAAIYSYFEDTIVNFEQNKTVVHLPFTYDFNGYNGNDDWINMFVIKLLSDNSGNCHSLPYLYKIIAYEMGAEAYLSLAPNHIYIKHRSKKTGWYNTELTSGQFPIDGWIMASGYISLEAIQNGIYMDTLSDKQNICLCLIDLAKGYEKKFGNDDFVIKCCDLALQYYPNYINAMLLKAEITKKKFDKLIKQYNVEYVSDLFYNSTLKKEYEDMEQLYLKIYDLGYREMPKEMYQQWLQSLKQEQEKYNNKKINFKN
jgi:hypothetical protein